jgi:hypothetical protein
MWVLSRIGLAAERACVGSPAWALGRNVYGVVGDEEKDEWVLKEREDLECGWGERGQLGGQRDGVYV